MVMKLETSPKFSSMADAIISLVLEQLASYVQEEVGLVVSVRKEVQKLTKTLNIIRGVLADAERKQIKEAAVKTWLEELKNIFYTADDVLDEWHTKTVMDQLQGHTHRSNKVDLKMRSSLLDESSSKQKYRFDHG